MASMEDGLRSIRDARGLRVNEDLLVWAARLETGRVRSGRSGVTPEILAETWRKMHITVSAEENADLMRILVQYRESHQSPPPAGRPAPAPPDPDAATTQKVQATTIAAAPTPPPAHPTPTVTQAAAAPAQVPEPEVPTPAPRHPDPEPRRIAAVTELHPRSEPTGPLPEPGMFLGQSADVMNPRDAYMGLSVTGSGLELLWEPAENTAAVTLYLITGATGAVPNTAAESERLLVTTDTHATVPAGFRYYAVFAYAGDNPLAAARSTAAVRQAVGQLVPSPQNVQIVVNPDSVVLEWTQPPAVNGVQLRRSRPDQPLPGFADTSLIQRVEPGQSQYLDRDVEPGRGYTYELVCLADAPRVDDSVDRSPPWSSGVVAIPATPERVDQLDGHMRDDDGQVRCRLSWPTARRGRVTIFGKPGGPGELTRLAPGQLLTSADMDRLPLGKRVVWGLTRSTGRDVLDGFAVDVSASPEWCYTPVTELGGQFVVGRSQVLTHVGSIDEVELTDRIFWQFLRFEWPTGAAEVVADIDGARNRTSREQYELYGGVRLALAAHPTVIRLYGTRTYRGVALDGRPVEVRYQGRLVLFYQFEFGRFGNGRRLKVRPEIPLPATEMAVIGGVELYPLSAEQSTQAGFGVVHTVSTQGGALTPADWTTFEFKQPEPVRYMRLFARTSVAAPVAAVEWPPPQPPTNRMSQRCPNCLAPPNPQGQFFRCSKEGSCVAVEDTLLTRMRGTPTTAKPWSVHPVDREGPIGQIFCAHCGKPTREEFCATCGETFPTSDWWRTDCFAVTLLGPTHSGKTSMLQAESYALLEGLAETWGGYANALDPASRALMKRYHDEWESGTLQQGTLAAKGNQALLKPLQIGLGFPRHPRPVAVSEFDVAGEDMEDPDQVALYANSLFNGDGLIYLVDPLQITEVRTALAGFVTLPDEGGATPVQALQNILTVLRRKHGAGGPIPSRLAVVFSKFDAIHQATLVPGSPIASALPFGSALLRDPYSNPGAQSLVFDPVDGQAVHNEARTLLSLLGGQSILNLVESNFAQFHYFVTSSTGHTPADDRMHSTARAPHRLLDPLRWIIAG